MDFIRFKNRGAVEINGRIFRMPKNVAFYENDRGQTKHLVLRMMCCISTCNVNGVLCTPAVVACYRDAVDMRNVLALRLVNPVGTRRVLLSTHRT